MGSRFVVGIDLGTTNSVLAWVDTQAPDLDAEAAAIGVLPVPQLVKPGVVEACDALPSFLYLPAPGEMDPAARGSSRSRRRPSTPGSRRAGARGGSRCRSAT